MIDLSKIEFKENPSRREPGCVEITGRLETWATCSISKPVLEVQRESVKVEVAKAIHLKTYGELINPIERLKQIAKENASGVEMHLIFGVCKEIDRILYPHYE